MQGGIGAKGEERREDLMPMAGIDFLKAMFCMINTNFT
jgi:hypothetical protein